jgi:hypothetical protein
VKTRLLFEELLTFLRHDFDTDDEESLADRRYIELCWGFGPVPHWRMAKKLQKELTEDLIAATTPKRYRPGRGRFASPDSLLNTSPIEALVEKINGMKLTPTWTIQWVNPRRKVPQFYTDKKFFDLREKATREAYRNYLRSEGRPSGSRAIAEEMKRTPIPTSGRASDLPPLMKFYAAALQKSKVEKNAWSRLEPEPVFPEQGQGLVRLGEQRFYVTKTPYRGSPRQRLYSVIIDALERGYFGRLRRCKECETFFSADDLRQKFCTSACMKSADRKNAISRVQKWRKSRRHNIVGAQDLQRTDPLGSFREFFYVVTKPSLSSAQEGKITPGVKVVGSGQPLRGWQIIQQQWHGKTPEQVWNTLTQRAKDFFRS